MNVSYNVPRHFHRVSKIKMSRYVISKSVLLLPWWKKRYYIEDIIECTYRSIKHRKNKYSLPSHRRGVPRLWCGQFVTCFILCDFFYQKIFLSHANSKADKNRLRESRGSMKCPAYQWCHWDIFDFFFFENTNWKIKRLLIKKFIEHKGRYEKNGHEMKNIMSLLIKWGGHSPHQQLKDKAKHKGWWTP